MGRKMEFNNLPVSGTQEGYEWTDEHSFGSDHTYGRTTHHFLNDPKAKFILTSFGDLLNANHKASELLFSDMLKRLPCGKLSYGSSEMNDQVDRILTEIRQKRTSYQRLLKRQIDEEWAVLEFSVGEFNKNQEILLTVSQRNFCTDVSLNALSKSFGFTISETEVVRYMSQAYCPKEISAKMDISTNTVRAHLRSIYSKTGVRGYNRSLRLILQLLA